MPYFILNTTVSASKIPANFAKKTAELISKAMNKPFEGVVVQVKSDQHIYCGADGDSPAPHPTAWAVLKSIGQVTPDQNRTYMKVFSDHIQSELNVPKDRFTLFFHDLNPEMFGKNGMIIEDLIKNK